jgi:methylthioribose-1-phosphate isomerase
LDRITQTAQENSHLQIPELKEVLLAEALKIIDEDKAMCRAIGQHGMALLNESDTILTHCNAGGLATSDYGTALAVMFSAHEAGKKIQVYADETRPLLQGARLTTWELMQAGIDVTLICDNMAAQVMKEGKIQCVIVGADRIAANGDTANKIGTYNVAILAEAHGIPFYVAAPTSTLDFALGTGAEIPIEQRAAEEVTEGFGKLTAPEGVKVYSPAFDVTPAALVTAIITEKGVARAPYIESLQALRDV